MGGRSVNDTEGFGQKLEFLVIGQKLEFLVSVKG
jgi:hypothetical protein